MDAMGVCPDSRRQLKRQRVEEAACDSQGEFQNASQLQKAVTEVLAERYSTPPHQMSSPTSTSSSGKRIKLVVKKKTPDKVNEAPQELEEVDRFRRGSTSDETTNSTASSRLSSPPRSRTGSLTADTSTQLDHSGSPATAFTALNGDAPPPPKRVKRTFAEKEMDRINKEIRQRERTAARAEKEMESIEKKQQKAQRDAEREVERQAKEIELEEKRKTREAKNAEKEKENLAKDAARKQKEAEKRKRDEEKRKRERAQPKLFAFLRAADSNDPNAVRMSTSPISSDKFKSTLPPAPETVHGFLRPKPETEYKKRFPDFYVHSRVKLAPITRFWRDKEALQGVTNAIDSYIGGSKLLDQPIEFNACVLFKIQDNGVTWRGKKVLPVREILAETLDLDRSKKIIDLTNDSQNTQAKHIRTLLRKVPYKFLSFAEDVRPPYQGTYTRQPLSGARKLARNPVRKDLPDIDYDYDSEAEWEEPGEGEDVDSNGEEDEEMDGEDDIAGFLDDENDELANARKLATQGDLETKSTGLCWENDRKVGPNLEVYRYRLQVFRGVHAKFTTEPIDPFAKTYWDEPTPTINQVMDPPRLPLNAMKSTSSGVNASNKVVKMFTGFEDAKSVAQGSKTSKGPTRWISSEDLPAFKHALAGSNLSKIGVIEVLHKQFPKNPREAVKSTIEAIATRVGPTKDKKWVLNENITA